MSRPRFAAITADLLARKGEARPWGDGGNAGAGWENVAPRMPRPMPLSEAPPAPPSAHLPGDWRKCSVRITHHDYERLGLLAVKRGTTRHHLLQEAVDAMLSGLPYQSSGCACIANAGLSPANLPPIAGCERP